MLDEIDFALAYFLFSLSAPGVAIIAKGRATLERTSEVVAQKSAELSDANDSAPFKNLELYILPLNSGELVFGLIFTITLYNKSMASLLSD